MQAYRHPKPKPNDKHWYDYDVVFDGQLVVSDSRDPEHDLARGLLGRGIKGAVQPQSAETRSCPCQPARGRCAYTRSGTSQGYWPQTLEPVVQT
jgi:hypothetical protein